jgi:hypothetical protein
MTQNVSLSGPEAQLLPYLHRYRDFYVNAFGSNTDVVYVPEASFTVSSVAAISLNKTSGTVSSSLTVTGSGFEDNETGVRVTFDGSPVGASPVVSSAGDWSVTFNIPPGISGSHTVDAYGSITGVDSVQDQSFSIKPAFTVSPSTAPPGATATATGTGFAYEETGINVTFDGNPIGSTVSANARGGWSMTFTVPTASSGSHVMDAYGDITDAAYVTNVNFTMGAGISLNSTSGDVGSSIVVSGTGFTASETNIVINFDNTQVSANNTARLDGSWVVPIS